MYTYESAIVKDAKSGGRWKTPDLSESIIYSLFEDYSEIYLILSHPSHQAHVALNLSDVRREIRQVAPDTTVVQWLTSLGDRSLPTSDYIPRTNTKTVIYNDLYNAGYKVELIHRTAAADSDISDVEKSDIRLQRKDTDYRQFYEHCLVTVNGLIHRTDYNASGVYVRDAAKSARISNEHHLGGISFKKIGQLDFIQIRPEDVYARPDTPLYDVAMVKLPEDIGQRIPILVLGGYLHILDDSYSVTGDRSIRISVKRIPYIDRFYASRKLMSLKSLEDLCNRDSRNEDHFVYEDLISDEVIKAYLTLDNSFIILVNTDNLFVEQHKLEYPHLPGRYYAYQRPYWPLMTELGRLPAYVTDQEATGTWVISVYDNLFENMRYRTHEYESELSLDGARESSKPYLYAPGYLLEIGSDVKA